MATEEVKSYLNNLVATQSLFYIKLHQVHWYIKGPGFFELHEKFEDYYDKLTEQMDEVAERLLQLGGEPYSTLQEFVEHSLINESPKDKYLSQTDMLKSAVKDFEKLRDELSRGIDLIDAANDDVTVDMLIAQKAHVDQVIWMLWAYLGKNALGK
ncbi:MAG: DNA starvation/stationary phase protection protein [Alkalibacterium sp.]|nr:DNA starvation/stationary phase protection protein [Alkalibacterium sp.]